MEGRADGQKYPFRNPETHICPEMLKTGLILTYSIIFLTRIWLVRTFLGNTQES